MSAIIDIYTAAINNQTDVLYKFLQEEDYDLFDPRVIGYLSGYGWTSTLIEIHKRWPKHIEFPWDYLSIVWAVQNGCKESLLFCLHNGCKWNNNRSSPEYESISNLLFETHFSLECFDILLQHGYSFHIMNPHFDNIFGWLNGRSDDIVERNYLDTERWRKVFFPQISDLDFFGYSEFVDILRNKQEEIRMQREYALVACDDHVTKDVVKYVITGYF